MKALRDQALPLALFVVAAIGVPLLVGDNRFFGFIVGVTLISMVWACGMNLLSGYTGLMPLMYAGIAGIAAYASIDLAQAGWSFWLALPVATLIAACSGTLLGIPSLRLKGFYFTLCSLVIQTVITLAFVYFSSLTNGDTGFSQLALPAGPGGAPLSPRIYEFFLAGVAILGVVVLIGLVGSEVGRRLVAVREDDVLAETLGINVTRQKLLAFFIASIFAAVGGVLYAPYVGFVSPRSFDVLLSLNIWLMVAFGGRGTIWGPIVGTALLAPAPFLLQDYYMVKDVIYGVLIIVVIVLMPDGIISAFKRAARLPPAAAVGMAGKRAG